MKILYVILLFEHTRLNILGSLNKIWVPGDIGLKDNAAREEGRCYTIQSISVESEIDCTEAENEEDWLREPH